MITWIGYGLLFYAVFTMAFTALFLLVTVACDIRDKQQTIDWSELLAITLLGPIVPFGLMDLNWAHDVFDFTHEKIMPDMLRFPIWKP